MLDFFHWSYSQHLMLANMNVSDIYVSTTGYLLQIIYISRRIKNSQHFMPDNPDFSNISIENYKHEELQTVMFKLHVYVTC